MIEATMDQMINPEQAVRPLLDDAVKTAGEAAPQNQQNMPVDRQGEHPPLAGHPD